MALLKREHAELLIGIGVLALGLGLLLFTFSHALAIATAPGEFFRGQFPQQTPQGPSASFTWDTNGSNTMTVQDTSRQGDVAITSWDWNLGAVTRAGWNMIKPKPETIRVRLKPKHLTQAIEEDAPSMVMLPPPPVR